MNTFGVGGGVEKKIGPRFSPRMFTNNYGIPGFPQWYFSVFPGFPVAVGTIFDVIFIFNFLFFNK